MLSNNNCVIIIPAYSSKNLFYDFFEVNNKVSWIKFEGYPLNIDDMVLFFNYENSAYYLKQNGEAFEFAKNNLAFKRNFNIDSVLCKVLGVAYPFDFDINEEVIIDGNNVVVK